MGVSIRVYHGCNEPFDSLATRPVSVNPVINLEDIAKTIYVVYADFKPKVPYFTEDPQFIESLSRNPDKVQVILAMGYDSVIYANKQNITKGRSLDDSDRAQYLILDRATLVDFTLMDKNNPVAPTIVEDTPIECLIGPVYAALEDNLFLTKKDASVGFHFGSRSEAKNKLRQMRYERGIEIEHIEPSKNDFFKLKYSNKKEPPTPAGLVHWLLLRKIRFPKPDLYEQLSAMSEEELLEVITVYHPKDDVAEYEAGIARAKKNGVYPVYANGLLLLESTSVDVAMQLAGAARNGLIKEAYLTISSSFEISKMDAWTPEAIMSKVSTSTVLNEHMASLIGDHSKFVFLKSILTDRGFDSIRYINEVDGTYSYIALSPEQVRVSGAAIPELTCKQDYSHDLTPELMLKDNRNMLRAV
jgi:hypothetical protein